MSATDIIAANPQFSYQSAGHFKWSPNDNIIYYNNKTVDTPEGLWALAHEIGHAKSGHQSFNDDLDLIKKEREAWTEAQLICAAYEVDIDEDYIEDCLDSYRDWQKQRATCPDCGTVSTQLNTVNYHCFNCDCEWKVSPSQTCRIRRSKIRN
ncbi:MAG: hypothetical protein R3313_03335 [Candidatus Saccharimonadales bacterium]|nr:hypothetical protein [Candidatus Saccharimonadales bacterium]